MRSVLACVGILLGLLSAASAGEGDARVSLEIVPLEVTVGEPLSLALTLDLPAGTRFVPQAVGPTLGPFMVSDGRWAAAPAVEGVGRWTWHGKAAAFRTGEQVLPAIRLTLTLEDGTEQVAETDPVTVTLRSVLEAEVEDPGAALSDIKGPASIPPDHRPLLAALGLLALLLVISALVWWLHRRYAAAFAAEAAPEDPFARVPPHEWVYQALRELLERRLAEQGEIDRFFEELSRILKRYLGGRYRVELLERTTGEIAPPLRQAGAPERAIAETSRLLERCDLVKFAQASPEATACREAIEEAYRIVDATKPADAQPESSDRRGVA